MTESQSQIMAVILYGSRARGDASPDSDTDICVFTKGDVIPSEEQVKLLVPSLVRKCLAITTYSNEDISSMLKYGSLFLWHVKLEGCVLYGREYVATQLDKLRPFQRHHAEIDYHKKLLFDLLHGPVSCCTPNEFDLSVLFTIARNSCMILSHKAGVPVFGRNDCYKTAKRLFPSLPLEETIYSKLSKWKTIYERGLDFNEELPSPDQMKHLLEVIRQLLEYADEQTR